MCLGPPRSKLCLAPSNGSSVYGTYQEKIRGNEKGNEKMAKNPRDSQGKNELIMGRCILINIYKG